MRCKVSNEFDQRFTIDRTDYAGLNWAVTPAWLPGDQRGHRQFAQLAGLELENGQFLPDVTIAYETWGTLNAAKNNAVLILHALTGDSHVLGEQEEGHLTAGWWSAIVGPGLPIDTNRYFVVAPNVLGGCQGSTGPASPAPDGQPWGARFPQLTTRDQAEAEKQLGEYLGIERWRLVVGPSAGGFRALEWACSEPERVDNLLVVASSAATSADQSAWAHMQLRALELDPYYKGGDYFLAPTSQSPIEGLKLARQIAHATYRSSDELNTRFARYPQHEEEPLQGGRYAVQSYLDYHGDKLANRFDPASYRCLTQAMITHDIGRDRGGKRTALKAITACTLVIGVDSDRLFPAAQCARLAHQISGASYRQIHSTCGHDGFLVDSDQLARHIRNFTRGF